MATGDYHRCGFAAIIRASGKRDICDVPFPAETAGRVRDKRHAPYGAYGACPATLRRETYETLSRFVPLCPASYNTLI